MIINLNDYRSLFLGPDAFAAFVVALSGRLDSFRPIVADGRIVGYGIPPEIAKSILMDRLARNLPALEAAIAATEPEDKT